MKAVSEFLANPDGGSRMSGWLFCALLFAVGVAGSAMVVVGLINANPNWWLGLTPTVLGFVFGVRWIRYRSARNAR